MRKKILSVCALVILPLLVVGLSACGGGDKDSDNKKNDPQALLEETFSGKQAIKKAMFDFNATVDPEGLSTATQPIKLHAAGPFETLGKGLLPKFAATLELTIQGQTTTAGATSTGTAGYINLRGTDYKVSPSVYKQFKKGYEKARKEDKKDKQSASLDLKPINWLSSPQLMTGNVKIGGVSTTHIKAQVDVTKMLADLDQAIKKQSKSLGSAAKKSPLAKGIPAKDRKQLVESIKNANVDVYVGTDDSILRKMEIRFTVNVPAKQSKKLQGLKRADVSLSLQLTNVGKVQKFPVPTETRPFSELAKQLGALGGGSRVDTSKLTPEQKAKLQAYVACVKKAGNDTAKKEACVKQAQQQ